MDLKLGGTVPRPWMFLTIFIQQLLVPCLSVGYNPVLVTNPVPSRSSICAEPRRSVTIISLFTPPPPPAPRSDLHSHSLLPQAEIVSLIATGAPLPRSPAIRPPCLGGLRLPRFKKFIGVCLPATNRYSLTFSRVRLISALIDPNTGRQAASIGIPLTNQLVLVGGLDVGGNFRGQIKYLGAIQMRRFWLLVF